MLNFDHYTSPGPWISTLHRQLNQYLGEMLKDKEVNPSEYIFIVTLEQDKSATQEELSELLTISKSATAKAMKRLEKLGYVTRKVDEKDRRAYQVTLTDKGIEMKKYLYEVLGKWAQIISIGVDKEDEDKTVEILKKMSSNLIQYKNGNINID